MTESVPDISVVIPAWNAERWIARAIDSVLAQTLPPRELIIVNDGSEDATAEIVAGYGDRVQLLTQTNQGLSAARNTGINAACGEWVAFLDADDYWLPRKLEEQWRLIENNPRLGFVSCTALLEYEDGNIAGEWKCISKQDEADILRVLFRKHAAIAGSGSAVMARKKLLVESGGFDTTLDSLEDVDMWIRLAALSAYACAGKPQVVITRRRDSMSRNLMKMKHAAMRVMRKNRKLLGSDGKAYWRWCYAGMLTDYAKWEIREGQRLTAFADLMVALGMSPIGRGRLVLGLMLSLVIGKAR